MIRLFTFLLLLCSATGFAQLAISSSANFGQTRWGFENEQITNLFDWDLGNEIALGYWFRLPKKRVEFLPTIYYAGSNSPSSPVEGGAIKLQEYGLEFKVNIYPFDFGGDCDCPTFGKQGPKLEKGFFVQLAPGYSFYDLGLSEAGLNGGNGFTYSGGIGLDIGVTNLLTITPYANARVGTGLFIKDVEITDMDGTILNENSPKLTTFQLGLRALFRFDHRRF